MMGRLFCSVCVFCFIITTLHATVTGVVIDDENMPVPGATVILTDSIFTPYLFGSCKETGIFDLNTDDYRKSDWLIVKCMGYKGDTLSMSGFSDRQTIRLRPSSHILKGVDVTASAKGYQRGDTITYFVNSFLDANDKSISDVIKKMPGLDVNKDGSIEFNGKRISSIYVEGLDMMGSKYAQISENLKASNVKNVQVLLDHQPINVLSDKEYSDKIALNLALTEEAKNVWQWNGKFITGYENNHSILYSADVSALTFSRKKQSLSLYKGNNIGEKISDGMSSDDWFNNQLGINSQIVTSANFNIPYLDDRNYVRNNSHAFSSNWLLPVARNGELRIQLGGLFDHEKFDQTKETVYMNLAQPDSVIETRSQKYIKQMLNCKVSYLINRPDLYLKNEGGLFCEFNKTTGHTAINDSYVTEQVEPDKLIVKDEVSLIKKFDKKIFALNGNISYHKYPTSMVVIDGSLQNTKQESLSFSAATSLSHSIAGFNVKYNIGVIGNKQKFTLNRTDESGTNDYFDISTYFEPILNYGNGSVKMEFSCPLEFNHQYFHSHTTNDNYNGIRALPKFNVTYRPVASIRVGGSYNLGWRSIYFGDIINMLYYTDSSTGRQSDGKIRDSRFHNFSAFFQYGNMLTGWNASLNANYSIINGQPIYLGNFTDDTYVSYVSDHHSSTHNMFMQSRISKSFPFCNITISLHGRLNNMRSKMLMGDMLCPQHLTNQEVSLRLYMKPIRQIMVSSESTLGFTKQKIDNLDMPLKNSSNSFRQNVEIVLLFGKWECDVNNNYFKNGDEAYDSLLFSNLTVSYTTGKYKFGVSINNIWNKEFYKRQIISETQMMQTLTRLRQREILAQFSFNL